ncbi:hypothetical protein ACQE98_16060 [Ornithinimicrobium sp. W1679]|uniref:hypothetical protein n=1 Tax=Ornithinimicrobium sp. W1679 TaxID=3418770 RepID=UPI003CF9CD1A
MRWRLRLFCGHVDEQTAYYTHKMLHVAFTSSRACPECGRDPATVVDGVAIGLVEEPPAAREAKRSAPEVAKVCKPTKTDLKIRVRELEAEVARLRGG